MKKVLAFCDCIQSLDSLRLAEKINQVALETGKVMPVYIEVHLTGEDEKYGASLDELEGLFKVSVDFFWSVVLRGKFFPWFTMEGCTTYKDYSQ